MPMASEIWFMIRHDDHVKGAWWDGVVASRAEVLLDRGVGLDRGDGYPEKIAHAMTASVATIAMTNAAISTALFSLSRNGLKPTLER